MDIRIERLAKLLVHYSNKIKEGDKVTVGGDIAALPLLRAIANECTLAGAHLMDSVNIWTPAEFGIDFYKNANDDQLNFTAHEWQIPYFKMKDASFTVYANENPVSGSSIDPKKIAKASTKDRILDDLWFERTSQGLLRWVLTCFPCNGYAIMAGMSLTEYEDFVFGSCFVDKEDPVAEWMRIAEFNRRLCDYLSDKDILEFSVPGRTDITMSVKGRKWIPCNGEENMPDGEVFTAPIEDSVNGYVEYTYPALVGGREVDGIWLEFRDGKVVSSKASKNQDFLQEMIGMDEGSNILGEVGIGTNFGIDRFTKEILFDEKIGGTFHLALGAGYPESGSTNKSSLHWDMICDLRENGTIRADGEVFAHKGQFADFLS